MNEWVNSTVELPEKDGHYEVTDHPICCKIEIGIAYYDGYGFKHLSHYIQPNYWRKILPAKKKYGKQI
jgi:hypothetical protein